MEEGFGMLDMRHRMDHAPDTQAPPATAAAFAHAPAQAQPVERSTYRRGHGSDSIATIGALALTLGTLSAFAFMNPQIVKKVQRAPTVVTMLELPNDPPPEQPEQPPQPDTPPPTAQVIAPVPLITLAERPVMQAPPVVQPVPVPSPPAPFAPPTSRAPENRGDLSAQVVFRKPIKVPLESRRQHEEGVVVLSILLAADGHVRDIAISSSSGFPRLDRAALEAVRDWRWSPTVRDGTPVMVRGLLRVPFIRERGGRPDDGRRGHRRGGPDDNRDESPQTDTI
ncbi:MAG: hypothetical protein BGP16_15235 [Sphingobium sp. 66-54]|nr:MAG: hypothetical protein BGP16_15235 [Sphingobium sp. 66-54]